MPPPFKWKSRQLDNPNIIDPGPPRPIGSLSSPVEPPGQTTPFQLSPENLSVAALRMAARNQPGFPKPPEEPLKTASYPFHGLLAEAKASAPYSKNTITKQEAMVNELLDRLSGALGALDAHREKGAPEKKKVPWWHKILYGMLSGATTPLHKAPLDVYKGLKRRKHHQALGQHQAAERSLLQNIGNMQALHSTQVDQLGKLAGPNAAHWQHALSEETEHRQNQASFLGDQEQRRDDRSVALRRDQQQFTGDFVDDYLAVNEQTREQDRADFAARASAEQARRSHALEVEEQDYRRQMDLAQYVTKVNANTVAPIMDQIGKRAIALFTPEDIARVQVRLVDVIRNQVARHGVHIKTHTTEDGSLVPEIDMERTGRNVASLPFQIAALFEGLSQSGLNSRWKITVPDIHKQSGWHKLETETPEEYDRRAQKTIDLLAESMGVRSRKLEDLRKEGRAQEFFNNILYQFFFEAQQAVILNSEGNLDSYLKILKQASSGPFRPVQKPDGTWGIAPVEGGAPPESVPLIGGQPQTPPRDPYFMGPPKP